MTHPRIILQDLYDSEINFSISSFWDAGFEVKLGDDLNGFVASGIAKTFDEAGYRIKKLDGRQLRKCYIRC